MAHLVPFGLALKPTEETLYHAYVFTDEPDIPHDTFQLLEWYCPNPDCHCQEASLQVISVSSNREVAYISVSLDPSRKPQPRLDLSGQPDPVPYAQALFKKIATSLASDTPYLYRLRAHYNQVKEVAADPDHPAHDAVLYWGENGKPKPSPSKSKRHRH